MKRAIAFTLLLPGLALAGEPISERADMAPDGKVTVINISGDIDVAAWDRNEVELMRTTKKTNNVP